MENNKKLDRRKIIKKLDLKMSLKIRSEGKCNKCSKATNLQCAHIISRTYINTRFDKDNLMCLCAGCHLWWHKEPVEAVRWLEIKYPGRYDRVNKLRHFDAKISTITLKEILEEL